jgi:hypothetical protein
LGFPTGWSFTTHQGENMSFWIRHPALWINDNHKDEDIFMPSTKAKKPASSKTKEATSSKPKDGACKGKGPATSKFDDDDEFMSSN